MSAIKGKPNFKTRTGKYVHCKWCDILVYKQRIHLESRKNHFCGKECHDHYQSRNKLSFICRVCKEEFRRSPSWLDNRKGYYCSIECRDKDPDFVARSSLKANMAQLNKKGLNNLELVGNKILDEIGVEYKTQVKMFKKFIVDVYIEKYNIVIQWDGDYWHGKDLEPEQMDHRQLKRHNLDKSQDAYMKKAGVTVLRFWDSEVKERRDEVIEIIRKAIQELT